MIENYTFEKLKEEDLLTILTLRNQEEVRKASINNKIITWDEHKKWFNKKTMSDFFHHYCLKHNNKFIGVGYGENFDEKNNTCMWGFYSSLTIESEIKYGSIIKYLLFERLFSIKDLEKIECQVLKDFEWIKDWHIRWGHKLKNFDKNLNCYNVYLLKEDWQKIREKIYEKNL